MLTEIDSGVRRLFARRPLASILGIVSLIAISSSCRHRSHNDARPLTPPAASGAGSGAPSGSGAPNAPIDLDVDPTGGTPTSTPPADY
jgi:hypothetical protein